MLLFRALHRPCTRKYTTARPGVQRGSRQLRRPFTHILLPLCEKLAAGRGRSAVS